VNKPSTQPVASFPANPLSSIRVAGKKMDRLPDDMLANILGRVPPNSLAASRCVREHWCSVSTLCGCCVRTCSPPPRRLHLQRPATPHALPAFLRAPRGGAARQHRSPRLLRRGPLLGTGSLEPLQRPPIESYQ
jgi:hypothetical protein